MKNILDILVEFLELAVQNKYELAEREVRINTIFNSLLENLNAEIDVNGFENAVLLNEFKYKIKNTIG